METLFLGVDVGLSATKAALCDPKKGWEAVCCHTFEPGLGAIAPAAWAGAVDSLIEEWGHTRPRAVGVSLALPMVREQIVDPTQKFCELDGKTVEQLKDELRLPYPVAVLHDGAAQLLGELAASSDTQLDENVGFLAFGGSIGFGYAMRGTPLTHPYTSWVSHVPIRPATGDACASCPGCNRVGCWRSLYQSLKGTEADPKTDRLPELLDVTAQGIATVLAILPMHRLFLGGGWTRHFLNPATSLLHARELNPYQTLLAELESRLGAILTPRDLIQFARTGAFSAAIGAAWFVAMSLAS